MAKHRHSQGEILRKLNLAEQMATEGKSQRDIANSLHVSVMTYHRWRKANRGLVSAPPEFVTQASPAPVTHLDQRLSELQLENQRLRKLVTDLLLEKVKLEEQSLGADRSAAANGHAVAL